MDPKMLYVEASEVIEEFKSIVPFQRRSLL